MTTQQKKEKETNNETKLTSTTDLNITSKKPIIANHKAMLLYKLGKARNMLKQRGMKKSGKNDFQHFTYFELADMLPPIDSIFEELLLGADFEMNDKQSILTIMDLETGYEITKCMDIPKIEPYKIKNGDKVPLPPEEIIKTEGKLQTYTERYLWIRTMHISEADPIDLESGKQEVKKIKIPSKGQLKLKQAEALLDQQEEDGATEDRKTRIQELLDNNRINKMVYNKMLSDLSKKGGN